MFAAALAQFTVDEYRSDDSCCKCIESVHTTRPFCHSPYFQFAESPRERASEPEARSLRAFGRTLIDVGGAHLHINKYCNVTYTFTAISITHSTVIDQLSCGEEVRPSRFRARVEGALS